MNHLLHQTLETEELTYQCDCGTVHDSETDVGYCKVCGELLCDDCAEPGTWNACGTLAVCQECAGHDV